jgi:hypothetical protein
MVSVSIHLRAFGGSDEEGVVWGWIKPVGRIGLIYQGATGLVVVCIKVAFIHRTTDGR